MAKFANCSCGGLKIDNDTIRANPTTGHLYVASTIGEEQPAYTTLEEIGYSEPTTDFNPADFHTYTATFPFGSKLIMAGMPNSTTYAKLYTFLSNAVGDGAFIDEDTVAVVIESHMNTDNQGVIKYSMTNGLPTTNPNIMQEFYYVASNSYDSEWERIYGDDKKVCFYTLAEREDFAAIACPRDIGKTIIAYEDGNIYQLKRVVSDGATTYSWEQKTTSLPTNDITYLTGGETITIDTSGQYVIWGNVGNLNITLTTPVQIDVIGTVAVLNLPATAVKTVLLHTSGYTGAELTATEAAILGNGSTVGKFQIGCVAL